MKLLFASLSLLGALTLSRLQAADPVSLAADEPAARAASTAPDDGDASTCPRIWRCDATNDVYDTRVACRAECAGTCELEVFCDGFCLCP